MCVEVTNAGDKPVQVIYSQGEEQTRHRLTIPAEETITIRYATVVDETAVTVKQLADYEEPPPLDGPV